MKVMEVQFYYKFIVKLLLLIATLRGMKLQTTVGQYLLK